jgi:hypothetical protein
MEDSLSTPGATRLLLGRAVLGAGESFIVAGALVWGLALVGGENAGMVMARVGTPPAHSRGLATRAYTACLDVALGFGHPAWGWSSAHGDLSSVFGVGAIVVASAAAVALPIRPAAVIIKNVSRTGAYSGN